MPGTIILKPLEAKIAFESNSDSYCVATIGKSIAKSSMSRNSGNFPCWDDAMIVRTGDEPICLLEVKDKDVQAGEIIGAAEIDLKEVTERGKMTKWYELYNKNQAAGQILVEIAYSAGEYPPDSVLYAESVKLSHEDPRSRSHEKQKSLDRLSEEDSIPEVDEESK